MKQSRWWNIVWALPMAVTLLAGFPVAAPACGGGSMDHGSMDHGAMMSATGSTGSGHMGSSGQTGSGQVGQGAGTPGNPRYYRTWDGRDAGPGAGPPVQTQNPNLGVHDHHGSSGAGSGR